MYRILAWGAFIAGLVPLVARPVLRLAADAFDQLQIGILFGSFTAVLILFSLPVTLLGTISPFAIRLAIHDPQHAGHISGRIYAISTLGSFVGTFLPVLVFIPLVGTTWTFYLQRACCWLRWSVCGWIAAGAAACAYAWMPLVLVLVGAVPGAMQPIKTTAGQIYETESAYNYIQVLEQDGFRMLALERRAGHALVWHPTELDYHGPWEQFLAAPFFNPAPYATREDVDSMAIVGLAAGTSPARLPRSLARSRSMASKSTRRSSRSGAQFFDMNEPNLNAIAEDGRWGLERSDAPLHDHRRRCLSSAVYPLASDHA